MKKILLFVISLATLQSANAQAFQGKGDTKFQVGSTFQEDATGISSAVDFGLGQNMSFGLVATFLLNASDFNGVKARFQDKADLKVRFNANIGDVLSLPAKADVYPGLHLGTRNFGAHLGFRYFFTDGFGLYAEGAVPLARYDTSVIGRERLNNQFVFQVGATFNL